MTPLVIWPQPVFSSSSLLEMLSPVVVESKITGRIVAGPKGIQNLSGFSLELYFWNGMSLLGFWFEFADGQVCIEFQKFSERRSAPSSTGF